MIDWLVITAMGQYFYRLEKNKFMVSLKILNPLQNAIQLGFSGSESSPESESSPYATSGSVFISGFISGASIFSVWYSIFATFGGLKSDSPGSILISCFFGTASILIEVVVINFFAKIQKYFSRFFHIKHTFVSFILKWWRVLVRISKFWRHATRWEPKNTRKYKFSYNCS